MAATPSLRLYGGASVRTARRLAYPKRSRVIASVEAEI